MTGKGQKHREYNPNKNRVQDTGKRGNPGNWAQGQNYNWRQEKSAQKCSVANKTSQRVSEDRGLIGRGLTS